ncbi:MAG: radical SAM protein [Lachnospiraceae bacterium]|nr:radical SAM protein [Lachnospiraceae bacterium]
MNEFLRNVNRIEFVVTMACTGKCKHCSEGEHGACGEHIDKDAAAKAVREICGFYKIQSLMTFGGEPLLYPETVACIHETAREMGIEQRDLITNGYFSKDEGRIREVANLLAKSGVTRILLSVDAFHQETIPLAPVKFFAVCVKEAGIRIELSPAWLVSREDENPYNVKTRECLAEFEELGIPVGTGNVIFPSGNALKYLGEYFDDDNTVMNPYEDDPKDVRSISFDPNGDVLGGNVYSDSMAEIIRAYTVE